jgi:hypothetical protein
MIFLIFLSLERKRGKGGERTILGNKWLGDYEESVRKKDIVLNKECESENVSGIIESFNYKKT